MKGRLYYFAHVGLINRILIGNDIKRLTINRARICTVDSSIKEIDMRIAVNDIALT